MKKIIEPQYSENDLVFKEFVKTLALGTITEFKYSPTADELKRTVATKRNCSVTKLPEPSDLIEAMAATASGEENKKRKPTIPKDPKALQKLKEDFDWAE